MRPFGGRAGEFTPGYPNLIFARTFIPTSRSPRCSAKCLISRSAPQADGGSALVPGEDYRVRLRRGAGHRRRSAIVESAVTTTESGTNPKFEADYHLTPDTWFTPMPPKDSGRAASCRSCRRATGHRHRLRRGAESSQPQHHDRRYAQLSIRLAVELRARHQDLVVRSPRDLRCGRVLHQVEEHSAGNPPLLRLPVHRECRRGGEQGRRDGAARKADRTARILARRRLSGRQDHRVERVLRRSKSARRCIRCRTGLATARCRTRRS